VAGVVLAAGLVHAARAPRVTSYLAASELAALLGLAAAVALVAAGGFALFVARGPVGGLCLLLALTWTAPVFVGWEGGAPALRAAAAIGPAFAVPLLVHLALAVQRPLDTRLRAVVAVGYVLVGGVGLTWAMVHNPLMDLDSWSNLSDFAFVPADRAVSLELLGWLRVLTIGWAAVGALLVLARAVRASGPSGAPAWAPALLALAGEAAYAALLLELPTERFTDGLGLDLYVLRAVSLLGLSVGVVWQADARRRLLRRLGSLVEELAQRPPAGTLEESLRGALRDDSVEVRYWARERGEYVDSTGRPWPPSDAGERARARVVRGAQPVALVTYDPRRIAVASLEQELGAVARIAIDNERLRAENLAHLRELTDSRARLVAAADQERRTLERNLHDGAQQRLLAVLLELRLALAEVDATDGDARAGLERAVASAADALEELRDFAHGVFPAVLDESGLEQALWSLADQAQVVVDLDVRLGAGSALPRAERAAYLVAKAAVDGAEDDLTIDVSRAEGRLMLVACGVGDVDEVHLSDRVGAVGGGVRHGAGRLEAVIPCE
jgi:signal transduction histidine kinase